jgi:hypothetical protein
MIKCILKTNPVRKKQKYNYEYITMPCIICMKSCLIIERKLEKEIIDEDLEYTYNNFGTLDNIEKKKEFYCKRCVIIKRKLRLEEIFRVRAFTF